VEFNIEGNAEGNASRPHRVQPGGAPCTHVHEKVGRIWCTHIKHMLIIHSFGVSSLASCSTQSLRTPSCHQINRFIGQAIRCQGDDAAKGYMFPLGASSLGVAVPAAHRGGRARQSLAHALLFVLNHARTPLALTQPSILPQVAPHNHSFCYYQIAMLQPHFKDFLEPGRSTSGKFYADDLDT
jgi:hypothetical protein